MFRKRKTGERGESIITVLISVSVLATLVVVAAPVIMKAGFEEVPATSNQICRSIGDNVLRAFRSNGLQAKTYYDLILDAKSIPTLDKIASGEAFDNLAVEREVGSFAEPGSPRWPKSKVLDVGLTRVSNTPLLIRGAVNGLLSVYNSSRYDCSVDQIVLNDFSEFDGVLPDLKDPNYNYRAYLSIKPYDLNTGNILPCSKPLRIRPSAQQEPPLAVQHGIMDFSGYRRDRGLLAEVSVDIFKEGSTDNIAECTRSENFQYGTYSMAPRPPSVNSSGGTITITTPYKRGQNPGVHLFCKTEYSVLPPRLFGYSIPKAKATPWVPCEEISICGRSPKVNTIYEGGTLRLNYSLPGDCLYEMTAVNVDLGGNISGISTSSYMDGVAYNCEKNCDQKPYLNKSNSGDSDSQDNQGGYSVGGTQFAGYDAAKQAAAATGLSIKSINNVTNPKDAQMNKSTDSKNTAEASANQAKGYADTASGLAGQASGAGTAAGARSAASAARGAATAARSAANAASKAAAAAAKAAPGLGPAGKSNAQKAKEAAEQAKEAADAAEEAARKAEQAAKDKEREESEKNDRGEDH